MFTFKWARNKFHCIYCDDGFLNPDDLREHNSNHRDLKRSQIQEAVFSLGFTEFMKAEVSDMSCKICNKAAETVQDIKLHLVEDHKIMIDIKTDEVLPLKMTNNEFKCALCSKICENYRSLSGHMNVHFQKYICDQCGAGFMSPDRLRIHRLRHDSGSVPCDECGKVFRSNVAKKEHYLNVHMKKQRHHCPKCPESFVNHYQKSKHIKSVHNITKIKEFKCELCPKVYNSSGKLTVHKNATHFKVKRYSCELCEWKFYDKYELRHHMVKHIGEKKFECTICKKSFVRKRTLDLHMKIHTNDKQFVCNICGKDFIQKCTLKSHSKIHHGMMSLDDQSYSN